MIFDVYISFAECLEFICGQKCISSNKVCDEVIDCNDGSDEENCSKL